MNPARDDRLPQLLQLRAQIDKAIAREAQRQGIDLPRPSSRGVGYIVLPAPDLRHAAAQIAAAAARWGAA